MSEEKYNLKSIKVYKFNNTKVSWHEFALKLRVIAEWKEYEEIIDGAKNPTDEKGDLEILPKDDEDNKKKKKEKLAETTIKKCYRDLVMLTEGISLNIVQN